MIFSTNPKGLALLGRAEHELPLPVVMGTRLLKIYFFSILSDKIEVIYYVSSTQSSFFLSVARSRASFIQSVDIQRENTLLQQI